MFVVVLIAGLSADSTGLLADSIDNLADATVFGLSIYAVGRSRELKRKAARMSGIVQLLLALSTLGEVVRRLIVGSEPESQVMMIIAGTEVLCHLYAR
jgi:Co/Zn/Cd efflux system component